MKNKFKQQQEEARAVFAMLSTMAADPAFNGKLEISFGPSLPPSADVLASFDYCAARDILTPHNPDVQSFAE